jgi:hypothetical protein
MRGAVTEPIEPKGKSFDEIRRAELAAIRDRREQVGVAAAEPRGKSEDPADIFGVACSGGGFRSASFCLGALQALDRYDLIPRIDYLSTVSGGGYAGASMVAAMSRGDGTFPFAVAQGEDSDVRDNEPVSHIRDNSRYLAPRGIRDLLLSAAIVLRGLMVNLLLVLSVVLPLAALTILINPTVDHLGHDVLYDVVRYYVPPIGWKEANFISPGGFLLDPFLLTKTLGIALLLYLLAWGLRRSYVERYDATTAQRISEPRSRWALVGAIVIVLLAIFVVIEVQSMIFATIIDALTPRDKSVTASDAGGGALTIGGILATIATATAVFQKRLVSWIQKALNNPTIGGIIRSAIAKLALYAAAMAVPALIYLLYLVIVVPGIATTNGEYPLAPAFLSDETYRTAAWLYRVLGVCLLVWLAAALAHAGKQLLVSIRETRSRRPLRVSLVTLALLLLICAFALFANVTRPPVSPQWYVLNTYLAAASLVAFLSFNFTENANALHRLYRDRLNAAFRLGKGRSGRRSLPLHELGDKAPYLLVNGTLNVRRSSRRPRSNGIATNGMGAAGNQPGDKAAEGSSPSASAEADTLPNPDPAKRGRNAEFFLFSKGFIGSDATGYASAALMAEEDRQIDLATAVAISGAAVSSSMGRVGIGFLGPTLALLNLRLGYWLRNPRYAEESLEQSSISGTSSAKVNWYDLFRFYLAAEAFGLLGSDSSRIYVTDGGHIDNIGLYQLLKRKCQLIIVIDGEADPAMNFGALVDVQRFARIDLGVRITLDWEPMRAAMLQRSADRMKRAPKDDDIHRQHFAVGKILYDQAGSEGILVYVKALVTGDEADYILDYERRYPLFPHESTGDQFFSEEQMEAYRALGFHAMNCALKEPPAPKGKAPRPEKETLILELKNRLNAKRSVDTPKGKAGKVRVKAG